MTLEEMNKINPEERDKLSQNNFMPENIVTPEGSTKRVIVAAWKMQTTNSYLLVQYSPGTKEHWDVFVAWCCNEKDYVRNELLEEYSKTFSDRKKAVDYANKLLNTKKFLRHFVIPVKDDTAVCGIRSEPYKVYKNIIGLDIALADLIKKPAEKEPAKKKKPSVGGVAEATVQIDDTRPF